MKAYSNLLSIIAIIILLASCKSTGQKALSKGDYYTACHQSIEKLRSSPNNKKAIDALTKAYPLAIQYTNNELERLLSIQSSNNKYLKVYELYKNMNIIAVEISKCPAALELIPDPNYYNIELEGARKMATEETYQNAEVSLKVGTRQAAKKAYYEYITVNEITPGYKDVRSKIENSKWLATLKVVIEQKPVEGAYKLSADFFQDKIFEYLSNNINNQFVRVFSPQEAEKLKLKPDHIIQLQFVDFIVGQTRENKESVEVSRDSVIVGTYKDNRGHEYNVYGTVKAKLTIWHTEISSQGILNASIIDFSSNKLLTQQNFPGTYVWLDSWARFNGDERALNDRELRMCSKSPLPPPLPQNLFIQFTIPIFDNLMRYMQSYYRNY